MSALDIAVVASAVAASVLAGVRWLRVAQREHYLAGSVIRFAARWWWGSVSFNRLLIVLAVLGVLVGLTFPPAGLAVAVVLALGPVGLTLRGRTAKLVWTRRLRTLAAVRAALQAVNDKVIAESPAKGLKYQKRKNPIRITPTFEQFKAIVADIRAQRFNADAEESADFVEFLGLAGLGQAEAASTKRSDVDLDAGRIIVYRHKTDTGFAIPLYPQLRPLVEKLCNGKTHNARLFSISESRKALANSCKRLGLPSFTHRSLRRMFITRAIERGVDVKVIAEWQGHRDGGRLILQTYSHVNPVHSNRMAQLMSDGEPANVIPMAKAEAI